MDVVEMSTERPWLLKVCYLEPHIWWQARIISIDIWSLEAAGQGYTNLAAPEKGLSHEPATHKHNIRVARIITNLCFWVLVSKIYRPDPSPSPDIEYVASAGSLIAGRGHSELVAESE